MDETNRRTANYIKKLRSNGKYSFTDDELYKFVSKSKSNVRKDIDRLRNKGLVRNIRRGFYTIIPDEYTNMGVLPVDIYVDDLMKYINKQYYVGLYSAAMLHGAAHQQPQEYYIVTASPKPRNIKKDMFIINFSVKRNFPVYGIEDSKTMTGYMKLSNKELTFFDLIYYMKTLGGINRIITILDELREDIKISNFKEVIKNEFPVTVYQRAGYILEHVFNDKKLSGILENKLKQQNNLRRTLLNPYGKKIGDINNKWKIQININVESDI